MTLALLGGLIGGCSSTPTTSDPTKPAETKNESSEFKVALLTPGPISDSGWSAMAYEGLKAIESDLGAKVNNQEARGAQIKDAMRTYAQDGYNLVIGHGFEYNDPAMEIAPDFPKTVFVSSSGGKIASNVGAFRFFLEQGFFVAGAMAAKMTKTGKLAMIGGPDVPSIRATFTAFREGAKFVKPKIEVIEIFTNKDSDIAAAKQATLQAIDQGADFVIHQANAGAQGVFDACKEKNVFAFGANSDQNSNPSGAVIASAVIVAKPAFVALAKEVKEGKYVGGIQVMGMDKDAIDFVLNPALEKEIPADIKAYITQLKADVKSAKVVVHKQEF